jgi:hypothetical protein
MTYLAEYASTFDPQLIMVCNVHDGAIFVTLDPLTEDQITAFNKGFEDLVEKKIFLRLPATWKKIKPE